MTLTATHSIAPKQNSVIALSDAVGNPVQRRGYGTHGETDAGQMTLAGPGTTPHPFGYTGRRYDPDLGLYYYRARWYDPSLGTFLQTDPIGSLDYINLYSYVGLEPGNGTDPTGMWGVDVTIGGTGCEGICVGGAIGIGVSYTREKGLEAGVTSKLQEGLGGGGGVSIQLGGFFGNMSDRNGRSWVGEGAFVVSGSVTRPLGRQQQGSSNTPPVSGAITLRPRVTLGVGAKASGMVGVQVERTGTVSARGVARQVNSTISRANSVIRQRATCGVGSRLRGSCP